jgi:hypothetical protein
VSVPVTKRITAAPPSSRSQSFTDAPDRNNCGGARL